MSLLDFQPHQIDSFGQAAACIIWLVVAFGLIYIHFIE